MKKVIAFLTVFIMPAIAHGMAIDTDTPKTITADKIEYDVNSKTIKTSGNTEIVNESGQRMTLTDSYLTRGGNSLAGDDIRLWLGDNVYVESDHITHNGPDTIALDATFTACDNCDAYGDAWKISTTKIVHDMNTHMLQFYNPVLRVYDIPVFWLPLFEMPDPTIKHKTGFLMPDFGSTNNMGTQINLPLYIAFSDTHDMTFTASYLTQENPLFQLEHRLNLEHSEYRTNAAFTHNRAGENRWYIFNNDVIELGEYTRATIFLERASDKTFLQKYGFTTINHIWILGQHWNCLDNLDMLLPTRIYSKNCAVPLDIIQPRLAIYCLTYVRHIKQHHWYVKHICRLMQMFWEYRALGHRPSA